MGNRGTSQQWFRIVPTIIEPLPRSPTGDGGPCVTFVHDLTQFRILITESIVRKTINGTILGGVYCTSCEEVIMAGNICFIQSIY